MLSTEDRKEIMLSLSRLKRMDSKKIRFVLRKSNLFTSLVGFLLILFITVKSIRIKLAYASLKGNFVKGFFFKFIFE